MPQLSQEPSLVRAVLRWLMQLMLPLLAAAGLVAGVIWLGRLAGDDLRQRGTRTVTFADIDCDPPAGLTRGEFLEEAQYLAGLPDRLDLLDRTTAERVRQALTAHPWVEGVHQVRVSANGVRAELQYRVPVLWVASLERAVDAQGVLLPVSARPDGLPVLTGKAKPPAGRPGQSWGDSNVVAAAKVAGRLSVLKADALGIEVRDGDIVLRRDGRRIIWGRPPGEERQGEPDAEEKLNRLVEAWRGGRDADLRK
jgi:hypothetical protein